MGSLRTSKQRLADAAYHQLKRALMQGVLTPGQRLSEPDLAQQFRTSRGPVREALTRLDHDGLLARSATGRLLVKPLELSELEQLSSLRAVVEGLAVRLATPRLRTLDLREMESKATRIEELIGSGEFNRIVTVGEEFHAIIARECGNEPVRETLAQLASRIHRFRVLATSGESYDRNRLLEHRRILAALFERDAAAAENAMIEHVTRATEGFIARIRADASDPDNT